MIRNRAFVRKVIYISAIALLLIPLYMIGAPSRMDEGNLKGGGYLADVRNDPRYRLSQVGLGEIDPAGEAMRLACLGMRGVAANILWTKANYYKKTEQFDKMAATVNQITKLQPNFIKVWEFHAHNLSFNTSVEYDDFRFRYHWVKRGLEFLMRGMRFNQDDMRLLWELGWFTEQKIGRSDEYLQFRRLFRDDEDFHAVLSKYIDLGAAVGPDLRPDCWLVAREWYLMAQDLVDNKGVPVRGRSPLLFHSSPCMSLMYYAMAVEEDGHLGQVGRLAWVDAGKSWKEYGSREIPTSYGFLIRLNDREEIDQEIKDLAKELDELAPGIREKFRLEKRKELKDEERAALDTPPEKRTAEQEALAAFAQRKLAVQDERVAEAAPAEKRGEAMAIYRRIAARKELMRVIDSYRGIVNFEYWRTRCAAEQTWNAIRARELVYEADEAFDDINLVKAKQKYEEAWEKWAEVFRQFPALLEDVSAEDVIAAVLRYNDCLDQLGEPFPDPFVLQSLLDLHRELQPNEYREKLAPLERNKDHAGDEKSQTTDSSEPEPGAAGEAESGDAADTEDAADAGGSGKADTAGDEKAGVDAGSGDDVIQVPSEVDGRSSPEMSDAP